MIQVASMFRDSASYVRRYMSQIRDLRDYLNVKLVLAEGDSIDETYEALGRMLDTHDTLLKVDHGGEKFGSVNHPLRWQNIAKVMRAIIEELDPELPVLWVESDLVWHPETMLHLVHDLKKVPVCAPMILADNGARFYDTWGYRINGEMFNPFPPVYEPELVFEELVKIDSCGSCFVLDPSAFAALQQWSGIWPFTADGLLWLDPQIAVNHR